MPAFTTQFRLILVLSTALLILSSGALGRQGAEGVESIMKLVPSDAPVAIVIPSLKKFSDELTQLLEGMDRANLLIGSRPIDQLKSITGLNVAVDDFGGAAIVMFNNADRPTPAVLIPVTDAETFLNSNLKPQGGMSYALPDGKMVYAKSLKSHVVFSSVEAVVQRYEPQDGSLASLQNALGARASAVINSGDGLIVVRDQGMRMLRHVIEQAATARGAPLDPQFLDTMLSIDAAVVSFDLDPLGFVVRTLATYSADSPIGRSARQSQSVATLPTALPNKPFYFAGSWNLQASGGAELLNAIMGPARAQLVPTWLDDVEQIQFAAYPSPAGPAGGLLNDSVLLIRTPKPNDVIAKFRASIQAFAQPGNSVKRHVKWEDARNVEGVGAVSAFDVKTIDTPADRMMQTMAEQIIFGRTGIRGFAYASNDAVVMTFSQRPAVLKAAVEAMKNSGSSLASSSVLKSMQSWMPAQQDFQMYVGAGELAQLIQQLAVTFGAGDQLQLGDLGAGLPPIAFGADVAAGGIETAVVFPSSVLALMIDQALANMPQRGEAEPAGVR